MVFLEDLRGGFETSLKACDVKVKKGYQHILGSTLIYPRKTGPLLTEFVKNTLSTKKTSLGPDS
jgi:hypothetical protein